MLSPFADQMLVLFAILATGSWIGHFSIRGVSLGAAGVLFTAMLFGHFGMRVPKEVMDLGLLLFVYTVGLQAGPRFFRTFRRRGFQYVLIGLGFMHLFYRMNLLATMGSLSACMTNPPGLGVANTKTETELPTLSYASVYPVALIFKIILAQVLVEILHSVL